MRGLRRMQPRPLQIQHQQDGQIQQPIQAQGPTDHQQYLQKLRLGTPQATLYHLSLINSLGKNQGCNRGGNIRLQKIANVFCTLYRIQLLCFSNASPSSTRTSRNQTPYNLPPSSTSNTIPNQSNAFSQATSSSPDVNGVLIDRGQSPIPPLTDVSSSSSTDTAENINSTITNGSRSSLPSTDISTSSNNTRLNSTPGSNTSNSTTSRSAPSDFHDLDLEQI